MKTLRSAAIMSALAFAAAAGLGCDGAPPTSTSSEEAVVKGIVTVRGKPATSGDVVFDPSNIRRPDAQPRRAPIGPDGSYTITTLVGGNVVSVSGPKFDRDEAVGTAQFPYDVPAGESEFNLTLPRTP